MEKEYITKEEAKNKYLTRRRFNFEKLNPEYFLSKDEAKEKYLTKKQFERELHMKDYLSKYRFNQFLIGTGIAVLLIWIFGLNGVGIFLLELVILVILFINIQEIKAENRQYNKNIDRENHKSKNLEN